MFPRAISESVSSELHNIFEIADGELILHAILIKRIIKGVFKPTGSFFHVSGDFLKK
jgi:hypothetical protein